MPARRRGGGAGTGTAPGGTSDYTLPQATQTRLGGVRAATAGQAGDVGGTTVLGWAAARILALVGLFTRPFTAAEKTKLGNIPGTAAERGEEAFVNPPGTLTGRQEAAVRAAIGAAAASDIRDSLMELLHDGVSSAVSTEQRIGDFTLLNDGNVVYLITVAAGLEFFSGDDISALREADGHTLDGVTIYSNASRHLLIRQPDNTSREVKVWLVDDVEAFAAIAARFLPTVTQPEAEAAIDAPTARQRRVWTLERVIQTILANRDGDAVVGVSAEGGELTFTRRSGTDPVDIPVAGIGGSFQLRQIGARGDVTFAATLKATGITPPAMQADDVIYLRIAIPGDDDAPHYFAMRGAEYNGLTEASVGDAVSGTRWARDFATTAGKVSVQKTASGELLIAGPDHAGSDGWVEAYRPVAGGTPVEANPDGADGGLLNRLKIGPRNFNLPTGGYLFYARPALTTPATISADQAVTAAGIEFTLMDSTSIAGRVWSGVDFATEWFGNFIINGNWSGSGTNAIHIMLVELETTHTFNGKEIVHTRMVPTPWTKNVDTTFSLGGFSSVSGISVGTYRPPGGNADGSDDVEITEADLLGPVAITYKIKIRGRDNRGNFDPWTLQSLSWDNVQTRSYQIDHGVGSPARAPATHNRYIGWSAAAQPTNAEFNAAQPQTDDTLTVPAESDNGWVWWAVPKNQGLPTGLTVPGNPTNVLDAFTRLNDRNFNGVSHYVYRSNAAQNAAIVGTGSYVYTITYGAAS